MAAVVGRQAPILTTSLGKSMLAHSSGNEFRAVLKDLSTLESRRLKKELEAARDRGYAFDHEENEPGVACVGAAILDDSAHPAAALSISGPSTRMLRHEREMGLALAESCREISRHLGYSGYDRMRDGSKRLLKLA
jgi:DNA-binding IclR family transcriptional regulator